MHVVRYYPRALVGDGGMTGAVRRWGKAMTDAGARVTIAYDGGPAAPPADDPAFDPRISWVKVRHAGPGRARVPVGLGAVLDDADMMVLHSGWTLHNLVAGRAARARDVAYILEPRGAYDPHIMRRKAPLKKVWWTLGERALVQGASAIHAFFEPERDHVRAIGFDGPVVVASNGMVVPDDMRWDGGSGGYVLWLGRFDPEHKGLDLLIGAMSLLAPEQRPRLILRGPDWHGRKAGVIRDVNKAGLSEWIEVGPPIHGTQKRELIARARAFIYPSRWDACPNSVLEAASMGVPTIATPYPLGSFLASRDAAILAEPTSQGLADALLSLGPDDGAMGARAAETMREQLAWERVAGAWLEQAGALL